MVRISDARMSGTAYGTVVLHVAPEAAAGGPLALVRTGDWIELDVHSRNLHLDISADELARRRREQSTVPRSANGGYESLFLRHIRQADTGADFDFLVGRRGSAVGDNAH